MLNENVNTVQIKVKKKKNKTKEDNRERKKIKKEERRRKKKLSLPLKYQSHKIVKHTQTICRQIANKLFECVWPFVILVLKGLTEEQKEANQVKERERKRLYRERKKSLKSQTWAAYL